MLAKRLVLIAVVGATTFSLTGCDQTGNHAAEVDGTVITTDDVSFLTRMQCTALNNAAKDPAQAGQVQPVATKQVRADMVNAMVQAEVNRQLAEAEGDGDYDRATFRAVMDQFEPAVQGAPKKDRDRFRELVGSFYRGQLQVFRLAQERLASAGVTDASDQQLEEAVNALQTEFRKGLDIEVNPVYGPDEFGVAGSADPSLSRAVSEYAKAATEGSPTAEFVGALPANLRCGG